MRSCLRCSTSRCCNANALAYSMRPSSRTSQLYIDCQAVDRVEGLSQRLIKGRMRVNGGHHRLDGSFRLHGSDRFGDQLVSLRPDDVYAENLAILFVRHHLHEPVVLAVDGSLAIRQKRELADLHFATSGSRLRLSHSDAADSLLG